MRFWMIMWYVTLSAAMYPPAAPNDLVKVPIKMSTCLGLMPKHNSLGYYAQQHFYHVNPYHRNHKRRHHVRPMHQ